MKKTAFGLAVIALGAGSLLAQGQSDSRRPADSGGGEIIVHGKNPKEIGAAPTAGGTGALSPISNHGGPVMATPTAYLIWYGNWNQNNGSDTPEGKKLVKAFLSGLNSSTYFAINTTYSGLTINTTYSAPTGNVVLGPEHIDTSYSGNKPLTDAAIKTIVANAINSGDLGMKPDPTGVYFVLTSSNVAKSGFCTQYCGWHTYATINGVQVQYSFVGNANRCLNACAAQTISPNGNAGVDGMISVIAHELEEATSDPHLNAWYDSAGSENADKCAWTFGSGQMLLPSGAYYNMSVGGLNFLVQRNLDASDNKCYVAYKGQQ